MEGRPQGRHVLALGGEFGERRRRLLLGVGDGRECLGSPVALGVERTFGAHCPRLLEVKRLPHDRRGLELRAQRAYFDLGSVKLGADRVKLVLRIDQFEVWTGDRVPF